MGHAGGVGRVGFGVLVGRVGGDFGSDFVFDAPEETVGVFELCAEVLVEGPEDVTEAVELGFGLVASTFDGHGFDGGVGVVEGDLLDRLLFDAVAIHVDGFENAGGEVVFFG